MLKQLLLSSQNLRQSIPILINLAPAEVHGVLLIILRLLRRPENGWLNVRTRAASTRPARESLCSVRHCRAPHNRMVHVPRHVVHGACDPVGLAAP